MPHPNVHVIVGLCVARSHETALGLPVPRYVAVDAGEVNSWTSAPCDTLRSLGTERDRFVAQRSKSDRDVREDVRCKRQRSAVEITE